MKPLMFMYRLDKYLGPDGINEIILGQLKLGGRVNKINIRLQMCATGKAARQKLLKSLWNIDYAIKKQCFGDYLIIEIWSLEFGCTCVIIFVSEQHVLSYFFRGGLILSCF